MAEMSPIRTNSAGFIIEPPLGHFVEPLTAKLPPSITLKGSLVTLEPLDPSHFDDLYDLLGGQEI
jgi:hypothetical protein